MKVKIFAVLILLSVFLSACGQNAKNSGGVPSSKASGAASSSEEPESQVSSETVTEYPPASSDISSEQAIVSRASSFQAPKSPPAVKVYDGTTELRAAWVSYLEFNKTTFTGKTVAQMKSYINKLFDSIKNRKMNAVIVQARPFGDAMYKSDVFPWSHVIMGAQGQTRDGFDPFGYMVEAAHSRGMQIHAWVNPFRVRLTEATPGNLAANNPAVLNPSWAVAVTNANGNGIYYNPALPEVRQLMINGVKEILDKYAVDGIHMDDYFYPTTDPSFDAEQYEAYKGGGGTMSLGDWRRENVNLLVRGIYDVCRGRKVFGISPQANPDNNYNGLFADVIKWAQNDGYVDYLCPQVYFTEAYNHSDPDYGTKFAYSNITKRWAEEIVKNPNIKLYFGLSLSRVGWDSPNDAGWKDNSGIIMRSQVEAARKLEKYSGFMMFRSGMFEDPANGWKTEMDNLAAILN